jgi:hypothetical protein
MKLDAIQQTAWDFPFSISILANPHSLDFALVPTDACPVSPEVIANFHQRGLEFVGVIGCDFAKPQFKTTFVSELQPVLIFGIAVAFAEYVDKAVATVTVDSGAEWLKRLHALPDTREN